MQKECKIAIFNFKESDSDLINEISNYLDTHSKAIYDFFEIKKPRKKVEINILTKKEYDDFCRKGNGWSKNHPVAKWAIGSCKDGVITYVSLHDYKNTSHIFKEDEYDYALDFYKKTILHEYVHFVNETFNKINNCNYTEKYLVEGIATYLSGQDFSSINHIESTLEQMLDFNNHMYEDFRLITKYFVENYDKKIVLEAFRNGAKARKILIDELYDKATSYYNKNK